jgi:MoxR-like ATPase
VATLEITAELARAASNFGSFFAEVRQRFPERHHIIEQTELALLSREHQLIFGPPGTGKSELASTVTRHIVDGAGRPSLYSRQIVETTVQQDLIGPVDFKVLTETGRTQHRIDEGLLAFELAVIDEAFDARDLLLRSLFSVLNEREFAVGHTVVKAKLQTAILTTNRYLSELLAARPETLLAFSDRVAFAGYVPKGFADSGSRLGMLGAAAGRASPIRTRLSLTDLGMLQAAAAQVEVDDEALTALATLADLLERYLSEAGGEKKSLATRYLSGRALSKAVGIWRAAIVREALVHGRGSGTRATSADLALLRPFFTLAGPPNDRLDLLKTRTVDARDHGQLQLVGFEQNAFSRALADLKGRMKQEIDKERGELGLADLTRPDMVANRLLAGKLAAATLARARYPKHREVLIRLVKDSAEAYLAERLRPRDERDDLGEQVSQVRGLVQGLTDLGELDLARRLAESVRADLRAEAQATPLQEVAEEFEPTPTVSLGELVKRAHLRIQKLDELQKHLDELGALAGGADSHGPAIAAQLADARNRTARAIRRRAGSLMAHTRATAKDLATLHGEVAPLTEIDELLSRLSPGTGRLRLDLLTARAAGLLRRDLKAQNVRHLSALRDWVRGTEKRLQQLEVEPGAVLRALRPAITDRAKEWAGGRPGLMQPADVPCTDSEYLLLNGKATAWVERSELAEIVRLVRGEGDIELQRLMRQLEEWDLQEVNELVGYLSDWFQQTTEGIVPGEIADLERAELAWSRVSQSKFYRSAWKEKELVTLRERIRELSEVSTLAERARQVGASLELLLRNSEHFGRALLERRAALSSAA